MTSQLSHTENVRQIINVIRSSPMSEKEKRKHFSAKYANFAESMPKLFDLSVQEKISPKNQEMLDMMLDMSEKLIDKKEIEVIEADKLVYGRLREDYIDPLVNIDKEKVAEMMNKTSYTEEELNNGPKFNIVQK